MTNSMRTVDIINEFEMFISKKSKNTARGYVKDVEYFSKYMKDIHSIDGDYSSITKNHIELYIQHCTLTLNNTASTVSRRLSGIRSFFGWLVDNKLADSNVVIGVERPKVKKELPDYLTIENSKKFLTAVRSFSNYRMKPHHKARDMAIMRMFLDLGLRADELTTLELSSVNLEENMVIIKARYSKGSTPRALYLTPILKKTIQDYLDVRHNLNITKENKHLLFISSRGAQYTTGGIYDMVKKYADEANLTQEVHTHMLRHTYATHTYRATKDKLGLQEALGHGDGSTVARYVHLDVESNKTLMMASALADFEV